MKKPTDMGPNRTGIAMSPVDARRMIEGARELSPPPDFEQLEAIALRLEESSTAPPHGTMPPPPTLRGAGKAMVAALKGDKAAVLLDKLGERLAFERTGTRLYELLLIKFDAASVHPGGPTRAELEEIRDDELRHFGICAAALRKLGADPTTVTPCANVVAVQGMGLMQVLADPRTTLTQALDTILLAELGDNDGWNTLLDLAEGMGQDDIAEMLRPCLDDEDRHLMLVRMWLQNAVLGQAGVEQPEAEERPAH